MSVLHATPRFRALDSYAVKFRLATLAVYGASLIFLHYAELLAEKVYNGLCSREGITFDQPTTAIGLVVVMAVFSVPTLLARSRALMTANLILSLATAAGALLLLVTASGTPYECFTMGGTYEDHTSGLPEFTLWGVFVLLLSLALLAVDLSVWATKNLRIASNSPKASSPP